MKIEIRSQDIQEAVRDSLNNAFAEGIKGWNIRDRIMAEFEKGIDVSPIVEQVREIVIETLASQKRTIAESVLGIVSDHIVREMAQALEQKLGTPLSPAPSPSPKMHTLQIGETVSTADSVISHDAGDKPYER